MKTLERLSMIKKAILGRGKIAPFPQTTLLAFNSIFQGNRLENLTICYRNIPAENSQLFPSFITHLRSRTGRFSGVVPSPPLRPLPK